MTEFKASKHNFTDRSSDSITRYFHDVNRYKMLSPDEEAQLARTMHDGGPAAEAARDRLVTANLRFVISIAKSYKSDTLTFEDLIAEGNIGLLKAAERFDETRGFRFSSYAVWWIRQSIMDALERNSTTLRLPSNKRELLHRFQQMQQDMLQQEQRNISMAEFCAVTGSDYESVARALSAVCSVRLEDTIGNDDDRTYLDEQKSDSVTDAKLDSDSLHQELMHAIESLLPSREAFALKAFYGIGCSKMTSNQIASELNLSHERARQLMLTAISKLRESEYSSGLRMYLAA